MDLELNNSNQSENEPAVAGVENIATKKPSKLKEFVRKHKVGVIISTVLIISLITFGVGFYLLRNGGKDKTVVTKTPAPASTETPAAKTYNVLDGTAVDPSVANRHPLAVIVENHVDARPQSGLDKASIVYEALAEGGITRFMALYSSQDAAKVGPIRSARTYFVDWAHGYLAYLAHVGGNIDALDQLRAQKFPDLDQFAYSAPYWREYAAGLSSEHTMYSSTDKLWQQASKNGLSTANNFTVYKFKDDPVGAEATALPPSQKVSIAYSNPNYNVEFQYDKLTNSYKRFLAGKAHIDKISKNQISPKNLIVMTVNQKTIKTRINEDGLVLTTVGSGKAKIFIDGKVIDGTWKKTASASREIFYDAAGAEITFNRGQFWISVVPPAAAVVVQ